MKNEEKILDKLSTFESLQYKIEDRQHKMENHQHKMESHLHKMDSQQHTMAISIIDIKDDLASLKGEVGWIKDNMVMKADQDEMMVILKRLDTDHYANKSRFERIESDIETTNEQVAEHHQILTKANLI